MEKQREVALRQIMRFFGDKKVYLSEESAKKELKRRGAVSRQKYKLPIKFRSVFEKLDFNNGAFGNMEFYKTRGAETAIVYLHGGAFSTRPSPLHWEFLEDIYSRTGASIYVPLYPLAPQNNYKQTYIALLNFYKFVARNHKKVFVMGDSAGATLTLGLGHILTKEAVLQPRALFALSPVVDMSFLNPEMKKFQDVDTMLSIEGARYICQKWARGANFKNPLVSPKFADFKHMPEIYLFYGNYEIFCPDLRDFTHTVQASGGKIFAVEQKKCFHTYPLMPIPKGYDAREVMANVVNDKSLDCDCGFCCLKERPPIQPLEA